MGMVRIWKCYFLLAMAINYNPILAQIADRPIIVLDPGHGGRDSGAVGIKGIQEKDIVLAIGKEVIRLNKELYNDGLDIYLTRYSDTLISLGHRTKLAKTLQADLFISIHCNQAVGNNRARRIEVYQFPYNQNSGNRFQKKSEAISTSLLTGFQGSLGYRIRGMKYGNFQVLRDLQTTCPAILFEIGFLSNPDEATHGSTGSAITGFAMVILQTLIKESDAGSF
jgi:N-acetylmuramoyl-L-alanine amidase